MKLSLLAAALALTFGPASAQQVIVSNSSSSSNSSVQADTSSSATASSGTSTNTIGVTTGDQVTHASGGQAVAAGGSVVIAGNPSRTTATVHSKQSGTTTIRSAPAVQAPSMGSGHPCAMSGSVGISIIGGGISGGAMKVDEACLLAQMGQGEAALIMIARRDPEACSALRSVGRIPASSVCYKGEKRAAAPAVATVRQGPPRCPEGARWDGKGCWMPAKNRR